MDPVLRDTKRSGILDFIMRIAISGASGLIGRNLLSELETDGHQVLRMVRSPLVANDSSQIYCDYQKKIIEDQKLDNCDVVIHLAGANIADHRWTKEYKKIIYDSRVEGTKFLCEILGRLKKPPELLMTASAVGYYGNHSPDEILNEESLPGNDFLAKLCVDWEKAASQAQAKDIRVIHLRFGAVLSKEGGALGKMLPIFQLGLGGKIGSGKQIMSWIAMRECLLIIKHLIKNKLIRGPVNVVSPQTVSNITFTQVLGRVINRPTIFPVPGFVLKILLGEMADVVLLSGANVQPKRLLESGYPFQYSDLESALRISLQNVGKSK